MKLGVPHLVWRDGRPRWIPSPTLRAKGFKGRDLKDGNGDWLPMPQAIAAAHELNLAAGIRSELPTERQTQLAVAATTPSALPLGAYVYFIFVGQTVKIGYSTNPFNRMKDVVDGLPFSMSAAAFVMGTRADEAALHQMFSQQRIRGEWFHRGRAIDVVIQRSLRAGQVQLPPPSTLLTEPESSS